MNIGEWVSKRAAIYPDGLFLTEEGERTFTNREFNKRVNRMAHALEGWGVVKGERVAVLMTNASEFLELFFACAKTGAIVTPVNFRLAVPEMIYILRDCAPRVLVYSADFTARIEEMRASLPGLKYYFRHGGASAGDDPELAGEALLAAIKDRIAGFKLPKRIIFVKDFPRNSIGKILKKDLKEKMLKKRSEDALVKSL